MTTFAEPRPDDAADGGLSRRDFLKASVAAGAVSTAALGAFYFGYESTLKRPVRIGVIGTGDEGSVLIGALNPDFHEVRAVADLRPYNQFRALHGQYNEESRPGLMSVYGWKTESEARRHVKVYAAYEELLDNAKQDGLEAVVIALPLHLHAPASIAAMQRGLHVLTEKLMGHSVAECKEMARVAAAQRLHLATGHQRHYNILYAEAMDKIQRGELGEIHFIRAQWHRSNLPGKDSWKQPLPQGVRKEDKNGPLEQKLAEYEIQLRSAKERERIALEKQIRQLQMQIKDKEVDAARYGYTARVLEPLAEKDKPYERPPLEELIRWRLWDRTGAGLMAELGSHQLDASSIFISAMHGGHKQHPLRVIAGAGRPIFGNDRDAEDHVYCLIEFPAPGYYDNDDPEATDRKVANPRRKIVVQYSSINGNGYQGYGELVFGTKKTLALMKENELQMLSATSGSTTIKAVESAGPTMSTQASGPARAAAAAGPQDVSRGYKEELEHWAWCIHNPDPKNKPRCYPKVAMADAIIALVTNQAAAEGKPIRFEESWFDPDNDDVPPGEKKPDVSRYKA